MKETRKIFLSKHDSPECQGFHELIWNTYIKESIETLKKNLELNTNSIPNKQLTLEHFQTLSKMFTYLSFCPEKQENLYTFIEKINSESPKNILLALASIMKAAKNACKKSSNKIFIKTMEVFGLSNYKKINVLTTEERCKDLKSCIETSKTLGQKHNFM